jgi:hypothetical protein
VFSKYLPEYILGFFRFGFGNFRFGIQVSGVMPGVTIGVVGGDALRDVPRSLKSLSFQNQCQEIKRESPSNTQTT